MSDGDGRRIRILFVCGSDFSTPGEKQFLGFAEELTRRDHAVMMSINGDIATAAAEGADRIEGLQVRAHRFTLRGVTAADRNAAAAFRPQVIHAINGRVPVVAAARSYARATNAPVAVHFEDDEWGYSRGVPGSPPLRLLAQAGRRLVSHVRPNAWFYSTRSSLRWAGRQAAFDALTPALAREVERRLGRPCRVILPVLPTADAPPGAGRGPGVPHDLRRGAVCMFTGTLHPQTLSDVTMALKAIAAVQQRGIDATFVHVGSVLHRFDVDAIARSAGLREGTWGFLGYRPFYEVPGLLEQADVLLSPGAPTEINRLRLPSKVQTYLASGTPTVTFAVGLGEMLEDRVEAMLTRTGESSELADVLYEVLTDEHLRATLARCGPVAAERLFDRDANVSALEALYREVLSVQMA